MPAPSAGSHGSAVKVSPAPDPSQSVHVSRRPAAEWYGSPAALYRQLARMDINDKSVRKRLLDEWLAISIVSALFGVIAIVPFASPPEFKALSGDTVWGVFGFFSGLALLVGVSGAVLVSIYTFFLNRVPVGGAHSFSWQFSHLLPLPLLNLFLGAASLTVSLLIIMKFLYPATFIAMLVICSVVAALACAIVHYMYYHVEVIKSIEIRPETID